MKYDQKSLAEFLYWKGNMAWLDVKSLRAQPSYLPEHNTHESPRQIWTRGKKEFTWKNWMSSHSPMTLQRTFILSYVNNNVMNIFFSIMKNISIWVHLRYIALKE